MTPQPGHTPTLELVINLADEGMADIRCDGKSIFDPVEGLIEPGLAEKED